jgi:hypothetical protein
MQIHPFMYFRAKYALTDLFERMPAQARYTDEKKFGLAKEWGPLRVWLYKGDPAEDQCYFEHEFAQLSLWNRKLTFELKENYNDSPPTDVVTDFLFHFGDPEFPKDWEASKEVTSGNQAVGSVAARR